jgi:hypothetical protein
MRKAMHPFAQGRIRKLERVGDVLEALSFDDIAHGLGTAEDAGFFGRLDEGVSGREGVIGKVQFEGPHAGGLQNKVLQKYKHPA